MLNPNALNRRPIAARDSLHEHWQSVARHTPLAVLTDLDGTLTPFAPTPEELTNPYHADGMARALDIALRMPLDERQLRHAHCLAVVERTNAQSWAKSFLDALAECPSQADAPAALIS